MLRVFTAMSVLMLTCVCYAGQTATADAPAAVDACQTQAECCSKIGCLLKKVTIERERCSLLGNLKKKVTIEKERCSRLGCLEKKVTVERERCSRLGCLKKKITVERKRCSGLDCLKKKVEKNCCSKTKGFRKSASNCQACQADSSLADLDLFAPLGFRFYVGLDIERTCPKTKCCPKRDCKIKDHKVKRLRRKVRCCN